MYEANPFLDLANKYSVLALLDLLPVSYQAICVVEVYMIYKAYEKRMITSYQHGTAQSGLQQFIHDSTEVTYKI